MKAKILIALTVAVLFGLSTWIVYSSHNAAANADVRICPNTGLPCDGDGLCGSGNGDLCGGGCCESESEKTEGCANCSNSGGCAGVKTTTAASEGDGCAGCPNKTSGTCPGKTAASASVTTEPAAE